jgi:predicted small integral membrane protein
MYDLIFDFISLHISKLVLVHFLSQCVFFGIVVSLRMTYPRSKHVALLDTQNLLSKYSCVLTDTNCVYGSIVLLICSQIVSSFCVRYFSLQQTT